MIGDSRGGSHDHRLQELVTSSATASEQQRNREAINKHLGVVHLLSVCIGQKDGHTALNLNSAMNRNNT